MADVTVLVVDQVTTVVEVEGTPHLVEVFSAPAQVIEVAAPGQQGIQGDKGDQGEKGDTGQPGPAGAPRASQLDMAGPALHYALFDAHITRINYATTPATLARANSTDWANRETLSYE